LTEEEKEFVTQVLRLFTQSDVQVGENYHELLIPKFKNNEVRNMLSSFANREGVHQRAYALLNDTLGLADEEYHAFLEYKEMADKIDFMKDGDSSTQTGLALSLAQSVFNEGMSLFASFVMLLNFQRFGKMKGMGTIVEWSIRDETIHVQGNAKLFREFCDEHPRIVNDELKSKIYTMAKQAVDLEDKFIALAFKGNDVQGLTKEEVRKYIRHIADRRLLQLGLKPKFRQKDNPLPWLDWVLNGASHDNFFEKRVTEYSVNGMEGDWGWNEVATA
jgi:glutaredoxin 3